MDQFGRNGFMTGGGTPTHARICDKRLLIHTVAKTNLGYHAHGGTGMHHSWAPVSFNNDFPVMGGQADSAATGGFGPYKWVHGHDAVVRLNIPVHRLRPPASTGRRHIAMAGHHPVESADIDRDTTVLFDAPI